MPRCPYGRLVMHSISVTQQASALQGSCSWITFITWSAHSTEKMDALLTAGELACITSLPTGQPCRMTNQWVNMIFRKCVSQSWKNMIAQSVPIQEKLFFRCQSKTQVVIRKSCVFLETCLAASIQRSGRPSDFPHIRCSHEESSLPQQSYCSRPNHPLSCAQTSGLQSSLLPPQS